MSAPAAGTPLMVDVAIVGGGLVGSALALALSHSQLKIALLEGRALAGQDQSLKTIASVADVDPRVSAITPASRSFLEDIGAWNLLPPERAEPYRQMVVWDAEGTGEIVFHADDLQAEQLGHILENSLLNRALLQAIGSREGIQVMDQVQVSAWQPLRAGGLLQLEDGRQVHAGLVVGADGGESRMRQWVGLPVREWDYGQQAIVCTVRTELPHRHTAWQRFSQQGPLAFLPLSIGSADDHYVSIVWSQDTAVAERLVSLDDQAFSEALGAALEWRLGRVEAVSWRHAVPLRQRHAKSYTRPGVALIGDAAHSIHPLAGQGVNLGFSDAAVLADEIRRGARRGLAPGDGSLLQRYERRRKGDNLAMMAGMEGFKQLFGRDELPLRWLRNTGMRWVNRQGMLKQWLAAEAMGLHKSLPRFSR